MIKLKIMKRNRKINWQYWANLQKVIYYLILKRQFKLIQSQRLKPGKRQCTISIDLCVFVDKEAPRFNSSKNVKRGDQEDRRRRDPDRDQRNRCREDPGRLRNQTADPHPMHRRPLLRKVLYRTDRPRQHQMPPRESSERAGPKVRSGMGRKVEEEWGCRSLSKTEKLFSSGITFLIHLLNLHCQIYIYPDFVCFSIEICLFAFCLSF